MLHNGRVFWQSQNRGQDFSNAFRHTRRHTRHFQTNEKLTVFSENLPTANSAWGEKLNSYARNPLYFENIYCVMVKFE
jgi:hypothetical protein